MKTKRTFLLLTLIVVLASGCSAPKPAGLTDEQLGATTSNILMSLESRDYQKFLQDMSDQMKAAFTEGQFTDLGNRLQEASGKYKSIGKPALTNNQGYAVYRFPVTYENETVYVTITFLVDGQKVEGLFFDSTNLRKSAPGMP